MKLLTIFTLATLLIQTPQNYSKEIIGSWIVTYSDAPEKPYGIWKFNENGYFQKSLIKKKGDCKGDNCEKEYVQDTIIPHRNGNWKIDNDTIIISLTSEFENGKEIFYNLIGTLHYIPNKTTNGFSLTPFLYGKEVPSKTFLKKKNSR